MLKIGSVNTWEHRIQQWMVSVAHACMCAAFTRYAALFSACLKSHGRRHGTHSKACGQGFPKADVGTFNGNGAAWHGEAPAGVTGTFAAGEKMGKAGQIGGYYHYHKVTCTCMCTCNVHVHQPSQFGLLHERANF